MLQILNINSRSNRACRWLFNFVQPFSYETLDFHDVEKAQHALLSNPRAVTLLISIHKNDTKQLYAMRTREYTVLSYCNSRPRGDEKLRNGVLAFGAVHFFLCLAPSVRVNYLNCATPPLRECYFCACSLWMCCWRSGCSPPAWICNSMNMRL